MSDYERNMASTTIAEFERVITETDPNEERGSEGWNSKLILLASLRVGQDPEVLATFTGVPLGEVTTMVARLIDNALWIGGEWVFCNPWSGEDSGVGFNIASNVALGYIEHDAASGAFALTTDGLQRAKKIIDGHNL